jgi:uncharacterized protein
MPIARAFGSVIPAFVGMTMMLFLLLALPAHAQSFPKLTGRVVDAANILPPEQEASLDAKLAALEQAGGRQLVVATIPDLQGYAIEDYGYRLGRNWAIGRKSVNDGAILIVAPTERKVRIEVGYGLEPIVTDALSSIIIQTKILPAFRGGDMAGGIIAGTDALIELLRLPDEQAEARAKRIVADAEERESSGIPAPLIFWGIVLLFVIFSMMGNRGRGRRFRSGRGPVVIWGPGLGGGWGGGGGSSWGGGGGGFSGGGGSFGGGGASGSW